MRVEALLLAPARTCLVVDIRTEGLALHGAGPGWRCDGPVLMPPGVDPGQTRLWASLPSLPTPLLPCVFSPLVLPPSLSPPPLLYALITRSRRAVPARGAARANRRGGDSAGTGSCWASAVIGQAHAFRARQVPAGPGIWTLKRPQGCNHGAAIGTEPRRSSSQGQCSEHAGDRPPRNNFNIRRCDIQLRALPGRPTNTAIDCLSPPVQSHNYCSQKK
jgi:hypothetical protein